MGVDLTKVDDDKDAVRLSYSVECEDGVRTINTVRISNCDGPAILTSTTESCPTRYSVSIAVILLYVVIVAVVIYNRRLSNQYTALVRDSEGQYEMKDMDEDTTVAEDV